MSLDPLYVPCGEVSVQVVCLFFNWVVFLPGVESSEFFMYFENQTLLWGVICKYIFPYSWFPFHFTAVFFAMQKLFILMRSHLFILSFMSLALLDISVKILLRGTSEVFLPMFSWRTFMMSQLVFKSFIHLEFIFVYGISWWSGFSFLHVTVQISQHHLLKRLFFTPFFASNPFVEY